MKDLISFPNLVTERLQLRQLLPTDAPEIFILRSDELVNKYLGRTKATSIEDANQFITKILSSAPEQSIYWGISLKEEQRLVGTICLWNISKDRRSAEIGYELLPDYHGKRLIQEAIEIVIQHAFQYMHLQLLEAVLDPANIKSVKLLEKNKFIINTDPERQEKNLVVYILKN